MRIFQFLQDENNRAFLAWLGGGLVVIIGAGWSIFKFWYSKLKKEAPPTVSAIHHSVAAGRDIRDSKINTRQDDKR